MRDQAARKEGKLNTDDREKGASDTGSARIIDLSDPGYGEDPNEVQGHNHNAAVSVIVVSVRDATPPRRGPGSAAA
jgi:hypothetical protein